MKPIIQKLWMVIVVLCLSISASAATVHLPIIKPSTLIDGIYIIPASTGGKISIASDGYCEIF